jgi:hypothetical protein
LISLEKLCKNTQLFRQLDKANRCRTTASAPLPACSLKLGNLGMINVGHCRLALPHPARWRVSLIGTWRADGAAAEDSNHAFER